jgi:hypothetical protein
MAAASYLNVYGIEHAPTHDAVAVGDLVCTGPNAWPQFQVIAVHHDVAWVRNTQTGADGLTPTARCRKVNGQPSAA